MQRRGVSRDALVGCLREMGREMPLASVRMLQVCSRMVVHQLTCCCVSYFTIWHINVHRSGNSAVAEHSSTATCNA